MPPEPVMSAPLFSIAVPCPVRFLRDFKPFQSLCDFFLLFLHEEAFHRIILVMLPQQFCQFFLFLNPGSPFFLFTPTVFAPPPPLPPDISFTVSLISGIINRILLHTLTLNFSLLQLVPTVIHAEHPAQDSRSTQIVHSQIAASLILIFQKGESSALASFFVAREIQVHGIAVLRKDCQDVAFAELER